MSGGPLKSFKTILTIFSREEWFPFEHLCENAPCAPDIDCDIVLLPCEHDFGRSVISRGDISRHLRILDSGETKIADLKGTASQLLVPTHVKYNLQTLRSQFSLMRMLLGFLWRNSVTRRYTAISSEYSRDPGARRRLNGHI